ncbi:MAG: type II toxin-antitoxin system VapC family toxin [Azoarcus sp.]|jgi:predicted nucleic acid-binding protein|nr:type II toxin-antitoxin system VapC family toxin [Azoarcus sp.]
MSRRVLLDTNLLIGALEPEPGNRRHEEAGARLHDLTNDPDVELFITPLIRYEVLRGVRRISFANMEAKLDEIQELPIREKEAKRAAELFRLVEEDKDKKKNLQSDRNEEDACPTCGHHPLNKYSFDLFHYACAEINRLEIASQDPHIQQIQQLIQDSKQNA